MFTGVEPRADAGQVAGWRMAGRALAFAVEVRRAGLRVAGEDVLDVEHRRSAQRVVQPLAEEVRELHDLGVGERRAGLPLCIGWPFFRNGPSPLP